MRIDVRRLGDADLVLVEGPLDLASTPRLKAVLYTRLAEGRHELVLDLADTTLLSAAAAGVLVGVADRAERLGGCLRSVGARGITLEALQILSLDKRLQAYDDRSDILDRYAIDLPEPDEYAQRDVCERWPGSRGITVHCLLAAAASLPEDAPERADLRRQAIEDNIGFAQRLARRFRDRGEPVDDLTQVAMIGLVNAVDGYDPERGCEFAGYATPTIVGEIRRYFRDKGWRIKVPRRLQELRLDLAKAGDELAQQLDRAPTVAELADRLQITESEVVEGMSASNAYTASSLDAQPEEDDSEGALADRIGYEDNGLEGIEFVESLKPLIAELPQRDRQILSLRFVANMTQSEIGDELGISQMHVSRLLSRTLVRLRKGLTVEE